MTEIRPLGMRTRCISIGIHPDGNSRSCAIKIDFSEIAYHPIRCLETGKFNHLSIPDSGLDLHDKKCTWVFLGAGTYFITPPPFEGEKKCSPPSLLF